MTDWGLSRMEKRGLIRRVACDARHLEVVLTEAGREAIEAFAPASAARVRKLFTDGLGPERLALIRDASDDVLAAIEAHQETDCPPEIRGSARLLPGSLSGRLIR